MWCITTRLDVHSVCSRVFQLTPLCYPWWLVVESEQILQKIWNQKSYRPIHLRKFRTNHMRLKKLLTNYLLTLEITFIHPLFLIYIFTNIQLNYSNTKQCKCCFSNLFWKIFIWYNNASFIEIGTLMV